MLHTKRAIEGLGRRKKRHQHNIVDLSPGIPIPDTDEVFTVDERKHTLTQVFQMKGARRKFEINIF